ncbi:MAG: ferritin family protein [Candidatus Eisenbacteria bacterium]
MTMLRNLSVLVISLGLSAAATAAPAQPLEGRTLPALRLAYSGELTAQREYAACAVRAEEEGWLGVRDLYLALADAEARHAERHARMLEAMGETPGTDVPAPVVGTTRENLARAFSAERAERRVRYTKLADAVRPDLAYDVLASLNWCAAAEATHARALAQVHESLADYAAPHRWYVCADCGCVHGSKTDGHCACGTSGEHAVAIGGDEASDRQPQPVAAPLVAWDEDEIAKAFALMP